MYRTRYICAPRFSYSSSSTRALTPFRDVAETTAARAQCIFSLRVFRPKAKTALLPRPLLMTKRTINTRYAIVVQCRYDTAPKTRNSDRCRPAVDVCSVSNSVVSISSKSYGPRRMRCSDIAIGCFETRLWRGPLRFLVAPPDCALLIPRRFYGYHPIYEIFGALCALCTRCSLGPLVYGHLESLPDERLPDNSIILSRVLHHIHLNRTTVITYCTR